MKNGIESAGIGQYAAINTQTGVMAATAHHLIGMLLDGAISKIATGKGAMQRGNVEQKGNFINSASSIIVGLQSSLDLEMGGEIARNLEELYGYMVRRLMEAHGNNDATALDEVTALLQEVKRGWDAIVPENKTSRPEQELRAEA